MPSFSIKQFPDSILRKIALPVRKMDRKTRSFVDQLIETMKNQPGGIGIAATQVGVLKQIAIVDLSQKNPDSKLMVLINPVIIETRENGIYREGCMSLPDYTANVTRAEHVTVRYQDLNMQIQEKTAAGLEARCIQHEVDHLAGMLFIDRVASLRSDVYRRKRYL